MLKEVAITILLGTAAMTASSAPPRSKPTVAKVMKHSTIKKGWYTIEEQILLDRVKNSPERTRDALLTMHRSRLEVFQRAWQIIIDTPPLHWERGWADELAVLDRLIPQLKETIQALEEMTF